MAEDEVFGKFPRFLEPGQKFADTLSSRSQSTSTPFVQRSLSKMTLEEDDSGYAEQSIADSDFSAGNTSRSGNNVSNLDITSSADHGIGSSICVPKINMKLSSKLLSKPTVWDMDDITEDFYLGESPDLPRPALHSKLTAQHYVLTRTDNCDETINCTSETATESMDDNSRLGACGGFTVARRLSEVLREFAPSVIDRVIGRKMLVEKIDFIKELDMRNLNHVCTNKIFEYLDTEDLDRVCQVNSTWRNVCQKDPVANGRRSANQKTQRKHKLSENRNKENPSLAESPRKGRYFSSISTPLTERTNAFFSIVNSEKNERIQKDFDLRTKDVNHSPIPKKRELFDIAAKSLKNDEYLRMCWKCSHPCTVSPSQERAICQNPECKFDFCVKCFCDFHGASPCARLSSTRPKIDQIGSKKCKRNLRRLLR